MSTTILFFLFLLALAEKLSIDTTNFDQRQWIICWVFYDPHWRASL
jgi:hypothetical protein